MKAGFQVDLEKAKQAQETAKGAMTSFASLMFMLEEEVPTEFKVLLTLTGTLMSLLKHTTEDPAPDCLSRRRIVKMIYFKL